MKKRNATLEEAEREAQRIGRDIGARMPRGWGFLVCVTELGEEEGRLTYVSSLHRSMVPKLCRELAERLETGEGSLDVDPHADPDIDEALDCLSVIARILTCPGVRIQIEAGPLCDGPEGAKGANELAKAMGTDFKEALDRALASAENLIKRLKPELLDEKGETG